MQAGLVDDRQPPIPAALGCDGSPELLAVVDFLLPALGPEAALRLRGVAPSLAEACSHEAVAAVARTDAWLDFLQAAAPPVVQLLPAADLPSIRRAANIGRFVHADCWSCDASGRPPLVLAAQDATRGAALVQALIDARASVQCGDAYGWTALMWAACSGSFSTCATLLHCGANPNHVGRDGATALCCATQAPGAEQLRIVRALLLAGANPSMVPVQGACADHWEEGVLESILVACRAHERARTQKVRSPSLPGEKLRNSLQNWQKIF